jgi:hypothetical protein
MNVLCGSSVGSARWDHKAGLINPSILELIKVEVSASAGVPLPDTRRLRHIVGWLRRGP